MVAGIGHHCQLPLVADHHHVRHPGMGPTIEVYCCFFFPSQEKKTTRLKKTNVFVKPSNRANESGSEASDSDNERNNSTTYGSSQRYGRVNVPRGRTDQFGQALYQPQPQPQYVQEYQQDQLLPGTGGFIPEQEQSQLVHRPSQDPPDYPPHHHHHHRQMYDE